MFLSSNSDPDYYVFGWLLSDFPDYDERFPVLMSISKWDKAERKRKQIVYTMLSLDEILDAIDDPVELAFGAR